MNFIISEGVKPGTIVIVKPGAKVIVPAGEPLFETIDIRIEHEELSDGRYRVRISERVRCNAIGFEGFTLVKFD